MDKSCRFELSGHMDTDQIDEDLRKCTLTRNLSSSCLAVDERAKHPSERNGVLEEEEM